MKTYLMLDEFKLRRALCRFRISAHDLRIESGRYSKTPTNRADRICTRCDINEVEDEFHLLLKCKLFKDEREILFNKVTLINKNFDSLNLIDKGAWLVIQEDLIILESLARYINFCFSKRRKDISL